MGAHRRATFVGAHAAVATALVAAAGGFDRRLHVGAAVPVTLKTAGRITIVVGFGAWTAARKQHGPKGG